MKFIKTALFLVFISSQNLLICAPGFLLQCPPQFLKENASSKMTMSMCFSFNHKDNYSYSMIFDLKNGATSLKLIFENNLPEELSDYENHKFEKIIIKDKAFWAHQFGQCSDDPREYLKHRLESQEIGAPDNFSPLIIKDQNPQKITIKDLTSIINDKIVVFYTGAGISAGVVPTLPQLINQLGICKDDFNDSKVVELATKIISDPKKFIQPMQRFYESCHLQATKAHEDLTEIVKTKNWGVLTENLDLLHQRTGIEPLNRQSNDWLKENVSEEDLKKIDCVITIGLSEDQSGFLGWYKTVNQNGKIVAINIAKPNYLSNEDYLILDDAQVAIPELHKAISK